MASSTSSRFLGVRLDRPLIPGRLSAQPQEVQGQPHGGTGIARLQGGAWEGAGRAEHAAGTGETGREPEPPRRLPCRRWHSDRLMPSRDSGTWDAEIEASTKAGRKSCGPSRTRQGRPGAVSRPHQASAGSDERHSRVAAIRLGGAGCSTGAATGSRSWVAISRFPEIQSGPPRCAERRQHPQVGDHLVLVVCQHRVLNRGEVTQPGAAPSADAGGEDTVWVVPLC